MSRGSIPGRGTKIPQAMWCGQKKESKREFDLFQNLNASTLKMMKIFCKYLLDSQMLNNSH